MKKTRLLLTTVAVALGSVALLGLGVAPGATSKVVHSKVKITKIEPDGVAGVVTSSEKACEKGRTAKLFYSPSGKRGDETLLGKDKTNKKGKWSLDGSFFVGHYRVVVPSKSVKVKTDKGKLEEEVMEAEDDSQGEPDDDKGTNPADTCTTTTYSTDE
jgi:hypothetical protein